MKKEQWEKSLRKEVFDKIDDISMDAVTLIKAFIKEQLEQQKAEFLNQPANQHDQEVRKQQKKEIIERIEQLKWEGRLTEQQKLDKLIKYINE